MTKKPCPNYLIAYKELWEKDPKAANLEWWKNAKFGMFIHYGLYSFTDTDGHANEWALFYQKIPLDRYARFKDSFTAHNFDVEAITDLAIECGMSYINLVCCHHDSFCLWDSKAEPFNSMNSAAKRNIVKELADACDRKGLGFFTYYTFAVNWKHPYYLNTSDFALARPHYDEKPKEYLYSKPEDLNHYVDYILKCMEELLLDCGTTAGIWLDLIMAFYALRDLGHFDIEAIYARLREIRPDALIAWKQGATGTEDFATPEQHFHSLEGRVREMYGDEAALHHRGVWEKNKVKHNEICATVQNKSWAFSAYDGQKTPEYCYELLGHAAKNNANLLLNVGPLSDGSISPIQTDILRAVGKMIKEKGYPTTGDINTESTGLPE